MTGHVAGRLGACLLAANAPLLNQRWLVQNHWQVVHTRGPAEVVAHKKRQRELAQSSSRSPSVSAPSDEKSHLFVTDIKAVQ
jgi:hypothetical protein